MNNDLRNYMTATEVANYNALIAESNAVLENLKDAINELIADAYPTVWLRSINSSMMYFGTNKANPENSFRDIEFYWGYDYDYNNDFTETVKFMRFDVSIASCGTYNVVNKGGQRMNRDNEAIMMYYKGAAMFGDTELMQKMYDLCIAAADEFEAKRDAYREIVKVAKARHNEESRKIAEAKRAAELKVIREEKATASVDDYMILKEDPKGNLVYRKKTYTAVLDANAADADNKFVLPYYRAYEIARRMYSNLKVVPAVKVHFC